MMPSLDEVGRQCWNQVRTISRAGFDFVFPRVCACCGGSDERVRDSTGFEPLLCSACREELAPALENVCRRCGAQIGPHLVSSHGCIYCQRDRLVFQGVVCLGVYKGLLRRACLRIKEPRGDALAAALAGLLWERSREELIEAEIDLVTGVPHHWRQRIGRAHNPATTLSQALARRLQVDFGRHILEKVHRTPSQSKLPPSQRRVNLRGAFRIPGTKKLAGRRVLLVDDIMTTGATVNEAAKSLLAAGAKRVVIAVLARGLGSSLRA